MHNAAVDFQSAPVPARERTPRFTGSISDILAMVVANTFLTVATLGVYHGWARTRMRRYLFGSVSIDGHPLSFHGTGREVFIGWLKATGIVVGAAAMVYGATAIFGERSPIPVVMTLVLYAGVFLVAPYLLVSARRYLLSRTEWRGVRLSFDGSGAELAPIFYKGALLTALSLGFYGPIFTSDMYRFFINHMRYGDRRFHYEGDGRPLIGSYFLAAILAIFTCGLSLLWFVARRERYLLARTTVASIRFDSRVTFGGLLVLALTNLLAMFACLVPTVIAAGVVVAGADRGSNLPPGLLGVGLLYFVSLLFAITVAGARNFRFMVENVVVRGEINVASIARGGDQGADALGDQMADALDLGGGIGL